MHQTAGAGSPSPPAASRLVEHRPHHLVAAASQQKLEATAVVSLILLYLACLRWKGEERATAVEMYI